jgi:hypothetical protein
VKVGLLTTWNTQCGIAEYSRALAEALHARDDVELVVLGSRNYDERSVGDHEDYVVACFDVEAWNRYGHHDLDVERILELNLDVLHVQYEALLYNQQRLHELLRRFDGPKFVTWHDHVVPPDLKWQLFDDAFTHREGVGAGAPTVLPHWIRKVPPVVRTFGLGRTREDVIRPICERNGWVFESVATSEELLGGQQWKPWRELHDWLRGADVIVLWYLDNALAGSSGAARTAIATRRPVIVNDTTWFRELPQQSGVFYKLKDDPALLESTLREILRTDPIIERCSTHEIVERQVARYGAMLQMRVSAPADAPSRDSHSALGSVPVIGRVVRAISVLALPALSGIASRRRRKRTAPAAGSPAPDPAGEHRASRPG